MAADPQYAEAWGALAATHTLMAYFWEGSSVEKDAAIAKEAARKALALDEQTSDAYLALAILGYSYDRDWSAGEKAFRRALELSPSSSLAHLTFANALTSHGRLDEALEQVERARQVDPISLLSTNNEANILYQARRFDEAAAVARHHLEMDPKFLPARFALANCLAAQGKIDEAIVEFRRVTDEGGVRSFPTLGRLGNALVRGGHTSEAVKLVAEIEAIAKPLPPGASGLAVGQILLAMGEKKKAIDSVARSAAVYIPDVNVIGLDPIFDPLRGEPEFEALCARLGLPHR